MRSRDFNLNVAIVVDSFFSTSSLVREVNVLPQSEGDLCVVIFHLNVDNARYMEKLLVLVL